MAEPVTTGSDRERALAAAGPDGIAARSRPLADAQLPAFPGPAVMLYAAQLEQFRDSYGQLLGFVADVLGVDREKICTLRLEAYRRAHDLPSRDPVSAYLLEPAGGGDPE